jgi:REP element-mobilizing transposase RayT
MVPITCTLSPALAITGCLCCALPAVANRFLSILEQTRRRYPFRGLGYVVMPEHIHLLLTEPELGTPSTVMRADDQNARGEAQVYTPQSSRARLGGVA